jgi:hypothetical protein
MSWINKPTEPGWYWWRRNHGDHPMMLSLHLMHFQYGLPSGQFQGPLNPDEAESGSTLAGEIIATLRISLLRGVITVRDGIQFEQMLDCWADRMRGIKRNPDKADSMRSFRIIGPSPETTKAMQEKVFAEKLDHIGEANDMIAKPAQQYRALIPGVDRWQEGDEKLIEKWVPCTPTGAIVQVWDAKGRRPLPEAPEGWTLSSDGEHFEGERMTGHYTGRQLYVEVTYVLPGGQFGIEEGFCVMGIKPIQDDDRKARRVEDLKTWPEYFAAIESGSKTFEVRKNDRNYKPGIALCLREWVPDKETEASE